MKLLPLKLPERVEIETIDSNYGKFIFTPLERGFGVTIGNALRRMLLSFIQAPAITRLRIDGVLHEFSTIDGVLEDVPQIVFNLKRVRLNLVDGSMERVLKYEFKDKGEIKAGALAKDGICEIKNPEQHIFTIVDRDKPLNMEIKITTGRGYVPQEMLKEEEVPPGTIYIDGLYSPVTKVNYSVENTRVGQRTDYEKLTLEVWTDGRVTPEEAVAQAAHTLIEHFEKFESLTKEKAYERLTEMTEEEKRLLEVLKTNITDLDLSVRSRNCLLNAGMRTLYDLVQKTEKEMLDIPNFGRKSLAELVMILKKEGLTFGMKIPEAVREKFETKENV